MCFKKKTSCVTSFVSVTITHRMSRHKALSFTIFSLPLTDHSFVPTCKFPLTYWWCSLVKNVNVLERSCHGGAINFYCNFNCNYLFVLVDWTQIVNIPLWSGLYVCRDKVALDFPLRAPYAEGYWNSGKNARLSILLWVLSHMLCEWVCFSLSVPLK